jgi:hypothetical protein
MLIMLFYFLKIIFDISISKRSKKYKSHLILIKKKLKFNQTQVQVQLSGSITEPNRLLVIRVLAIMRFESVLVL